MAFTSSSLHYFLHKQEQPLHIQGHILSAVVSRPGQGQGLLYHCRHQLINLLISASFPDFTALPQVELGRQYIIIGSTDFFYWLCCIGKVLHLQSAQLACFKLGTCHMHNQFSCVYKISAM